jgi:hypothetical protein
MACGAISASMSRYSRQAPGAGHFRVVERFRVLRRRESGRFVLGLDETESP